LENWNDDQLKIPNGWRSGHNQQMKAVPEPLVRNDAAIQAAFSRHKVGVADRNIQDIITLPSMLAIGEPGISHCSAGSPEASMGRQFSH
jgi:hypothetical protein